MIEYQGKQIEEIIYNGKYLYNPYQIGELIDLSKEGVRKAIS